MKIGLVYIWFDKKLKRYYVGSHWGYEDDGYICSSRWMLNTYTKRPEDFKRRIIKRIYTNRKDLLDEEQRFLNMIKPIEIVSSYNNTTNEKRNLNVRYYNINLNINDFWHTYEGDIKKSIGEKISIKKKGKSTGPCSEETKEKIRKSTKGLKKTYTEESYKSLVESHTGVFKSDKWKEAASERLKAQWDSGIRRGTPATEERKLKVSEANKGRQLSVPTEESRKKQSEKKKLYWENVKAGLIPPRKPRSKKITIDPLLFHKD